jgi:hypothetical protein
MTQQQLDRAVSQVTGETVEFVRRRGFSVVTPASIFDPDTDELTPPQMVDWDEIAVHRSRQAA